jgi:TfoX/Sxy family transcriptional regulator of competence genes
MHSDPGLVGRIRDRLAGTPGVTEKVMFGGVAFFVGGNVAAGVWHDDLIVRVGPEAGAAALAEPHVRPFDITGRPMAAWVMVEPDGIDSERQLADWLDRAVAFAGSLPVKPVKPTKSKRRR